jgi:Rod binding domain-containing protein
MMQELMKPLNRGAALTGADGDSDADSGSAGALGEYATEALGRALSQRGGFGIATSIVKQLSPAVHQIGTIPVIGNVPVNTVLKASQ